MFCLPEHFIELRKASMATRTLAFLKQREPWTAEVFSGYSLPFAPAGWRSTPSRILRVFEWKDGMKSMNCWFVCGRNSGAETKPGKLAARAGATGRK
jgi:hypothetical protein